MHEANAAKRILLGESEPRLVLAMTNLLKSEGYDVESVTEPKANPPLRRYEFGNIKVDLEKRRVLRAGKKVKLSDREFALLQYLIERQGKVISRDEVLIHVWAYHTAPATRTVDTHIWLLRRALERDPRNPQFIVTVHSQGYRFVGGRGVSIQDGQQR